VEDLKKWIGRRKKGEPEEEPRRGPRTVPLALWGEGQGTFGMGGAKKSSKGDEGGRWIPGKSGIFEGQASPDHGLLMGEPTKSMQVNWPVNRKKKESTGKRREKASVFDKRKTRLD